MRYPEGGRSNSINISSDGSVEGVGGSRRPQPLRFPSSSSASQDSQNSLPEHEENENDLPGRTQTGTPTAAAASGRRANIETISEHVLFGNNNGHNSFLYLYYSSSSSHNNNSRNTSDNILRRPYTTTGGFKGGKVMGDNIQQKHQPWNDLSGTGRGSAGPSPMFHNNNEEDDEDDSFAFDDDEKDGKGKVKDVGLSSSGNSNDSSDKDKNANVCAPYPVYLSPVEGSPIRLPSISPKKSVEDDDDDDEEDEEEDTRTSGRITGGPRQDRLDSFGADLLDDEWDKIYSVADVDARYVLSPSPINKVGTKRKANEEKDEDDDDDDSGPISSSSMHHHHDHRIRYNDNSSYKKVQERTIRKQPSTSSSTNTNNTVSSFHSSANSVTNKQGSIKRVRVHPNDAKRSSSEDASSMKKWGSTNSVKSGVNGKKLSPLSSSGPSRTPSTRSLKRGNSTRHGVTHHHHKPLDSENTNNNDGGPHNAAGGKRASSTNTGDEQVTYPLRNGIGAYFGTPASRQISQKNEPTPEEMYNEEMQGWRPRLATAATIFTATLFILSCASLLFVFPILVDPILVGFEADFSIEPVMCRTTNFRNGSGPSECATPSCREGCTLDLFACIFVDVEYYTLNNGMNANNLLLESSKNNSNNNNTATTDEISEVANSSSISSHQKRSATLLINVNGCGYPPEVTCSDFEKKYAPLNTQFPCYYSQKNESIVLPAYSRRTEIIHLTLAVCVPFGIIFASGTSLYLLVRYHKYLKATINRKFAARKKAVRAKRREDRERMIASNVNKDEQTLSDDEDVKEDATSISELEPHEEYNYRKNIKAMQNGASRTGAETRLMINNTEM